MKKLVFLLMLFSILWPAVAQQRDALESYRQGKYQEAVDICLDELRSFPENLDSYIVLSWSLQKLNKHQEALTYLLQAQKLHAYDFRIIEALGESYFYLGRNMEALKKFEHYTVLSPSGDRIERVYYFMGEIYLQLGRPHHADIALTTAVCHAPQVPTWWMRLGYARMLAKDYVYAKKAFEEALRQNPDLTEAQRGKQQVENLMANFSR